MDPRPGKRIADCVGQDECGRSRNRMEEGRQTGAQRALRPPGRDYLPPMPFLSSFLLSSAAFSSEDTLPISTMQIPAAHQGDH